MMKAFSTRHFFVLADSLTSKQVNLMGMRVDNVSISEVFCQSIWQFVCLTSDDFRYVVDIQTYVNPMYSFKKLAKAKK